LYHLSFIPLHFGSFTPFSTSAPGDTLKLQHFENGMKNLRHEKSENESHGTYMPSDGDIMASGNCQRESMDLVMNLVKSVFVGN
jgi:hypothetical protein